LNPRITAIPLLFDQARGSVSLAIGRNSFYGGKSRTPSFTAYQTLGGATFTVDGHTIIESGELV
jgi:hypothetical protein